MQNQPNKIQEVFAGSSEVAQRLREYDWENSVLGPVSDWPQSLVTVIRIMLTSRQPIWVGWGEDLIYFYNDAYKSVIGGRHPWALGKPLKAVWQEIWSEIEPMLLEAMQGTEGTYVEAQLLIMERNGYPEETRYTFSYSPVPDGNKTGGIICANTDDTQRVISERQLSLLSSLGTIAGTVKDRASACQRSMEALSENLLDLPFAALYLLDSETGSLQLSGASGCDQANHWPQSLPVGDELWPMASVLAGQQAVVADLAAKMPAGVPSGGWHKPPEQALLMPLSPGNDSAPDGVFIAGLNPFRLLDGKYQDFLSLVTGQIASVIAGAEAYELERKRAEKLAELDRAKTLFFSNVSHEFRTPLTLLSAPLEKLIGSHGQQPELAEDLAVMQRNSQRLLKLVNTLLDFSRVEAGRSKALFAPQNLSELTADLSANFRSAFDKASLAFTVEARSLPQPVYLDTDMWEKVIFNLLSNAFKFTFEGGVTVRVEADHGNASVIIEDTGTGIPAQDLPTIFERFHRVEGARGRSFEGSGIGLALVKELVELHGGEITVSSQEHAGTRFVIRLPFGYGHLPPQQVQHQAAHLTEDERANPFLTEALSWLSAEDVLPPEEDPSPLAQSKKTILLVDDNADMRNYVSSILREDYAVLAVRDGVAALEALEQKTPHLILTDVMMPRLDGFGLLHAVRDNPDTKNIPVVLLSARAGEEAKIEGINAGAADYLVKPFSARELKARLHALLVQNEMRQAQESHFRIVADNAPAVLWTTDPDGLCTYLSRQWYETTGGTPAEDLGYGWLNRVHPDDFEHAKDIFLGANKAQTAFRIEYRLRVKNGEYRTVIDAALPRFDDAGKFLGYVGCVFDIAERRRVELILNGQKRALELSISGAPLSKILEELVLSVERQSSARVRASILLFDESEQRLLHGAAPSLPAMFNEAVNEIAIGPGAGSCGTAAWMRQPVISRDIATDPHWRSYKNIALLHNLHACCSYPVISAGGQLLGAIAIYYPQPIDEPPEGDMQAIDILGNTAALIIDKAIDARLRKEADKKLRASEVALREADKRKDEFLATLAHELRNPLAPIGNALQIMRLSRDENALEDMRDLISRQLTQMVRLVDDLMDVSRITRGKVELRKEQVSLNAVLKNAAEVVQPLAMEREQLLKVRIPDEELWLEGDFTRLSQVFTNILNNASKYTQHRGRIDARVHAGEGSVQVVVEDNGLGIPPDKLPFIFEMFSQVEDPLGRAHGGLGIGLTLADQLVKMHGGSIEAYSEGISRGSRFTVTLPLLDLNAAQEGVAPNDGLPGVGSLDILVVDDNRESASTLGQLLELLGHQVTVCFDGAAALLAVERWAPDLVLMDIGMPDMNGYECCRVMKAMPSLQNTVIAAQTGWSEKRHQQSAHEAGFDLHMVKPLDVEKLKALLTEVVSNRV